MIRQWVDGGASLSQIEAGVINLLDLMLCSRHCRRETAWALREAWFMKLRCLKYREGYKLWLAYCDYYIDSLAPTLSRNQ